MNELRKAAEMALEAIELHVGMYPHMDKGFMVDAREALRQAIEEAEKQAPVPCIVGIKGSAFDLPTTKRAYTYANQPNNGVAHRLGMASYSANCERSGDGIDMGLILLKYLQAAGYGVFDLGAEYAASNKPDVILISEGEDHVS